MNYLIRTTRDGDNQVKVLKKIAENTYNLEWTFTLKGDDEPIILSERFNEDGFIIANWNAWVRIYNISKKELIFEKKCNGDMDSTVIISDDKTKLYIAYSTVDNEPFVEIISLLDFSTLKIHKLPIFFNIQYFTLGHNNKLMFYDTDENRKDNTWTHAYNILNEKARKIENFPMEYPQWAKFNEKPPVISTKHNVGIMPLWDNIEVKKEDVNNPLFVFKVMLFNLTDFKVEKIISVRDFTKQQLSNYETTCDEHAEIFQTKNKENEDYKEAVEDFMEQLSSIFFDKVSDSFWVCFRDGIRKNITLNGKLLPLIEKKLTKEEPIKIVTSKKDDLALEEENKVVIEVSDLNQERSYLDALDKMIKLTQNIDAIKSGHLLIFRVKDKENYEEEISFFKKAIKVEGAAEKIEAIVTNFINYKEEYLWLNDETPAITYAILALVRKDKKWIPNYIDFLRCCDLDHEVEQSGDIQEIIEKYGWCEEVCRLAIARMVSCAGQHGIEQFDEFLENGLNDYLKALENKTMFFKNVIQEFNEADKIKRYLSHPKEQYLDNISMWVEFFEVVLTEIEMKTLNNEVSLLWDKHNKNSSRSLR